MERRKWWGEQVSLGTVTPLPPEQPQLRVGLDALGNDLEIEGAAELDQRMHDGPLFRGVFQPGDE